MKRLLTLCAIILILLTIVLWKIDKPALSTARHSLKTGLDIVKSALSGGKHLSPNTSNSAAAGEQQIILNTAMIYPLIAQTNYAALVDEQKSESPQTKITFPNSPDQDFYQAYHAGYIFDLGANYSLSRIRFWMGYGNPETISVYYGDPHDWKLAGAVVLKISSGGWTELEFPGQCRSRFIKIDLHSRKAEINEIALFGKLFGPAIGVMLKPKNNRAYPAMDKLLGVNGWVWTGSDLLSCATSVREYHSWGWNDTGNYEYGFDPAYRFTTDQAYQNWQLNGIDINPCLQLSPAYISKGIDPNCKPLQPGTDATNPASYLAHANYLYQFAARYGANKKVDPSTIKLKAGEIKKAGLARVKYIENWNEPDKWWVGGEYLNNTKINDVHFRPLELAAMASADYDGHNAAMGKTAGVKNADPAMKMVLGGLANLDLDYIRTIKLWSDYNRKDKSFPADVISFHYYCNNANGQLGNASTGVCPEVNGLKNKLKRIVEYRNTYLPGVEIWLSEFGYDTDPGSVDRAPAIAPLSAYEVQARWLMRCYLEIAAAGIDRAHWFVINDHVSDGPYSGSTFNTCGLVKDQNHHYEKKPAWYYMAFLKNILRGYHFTKEIATRSRIVNVYEFANRKGNIMYALWCPTETNNTSTYSLNLGAAKNAFLITPVDTSSGAAIVPLKIPKGKTKMITVNVSEKPVFVKVIPR